MKRSISILTVAIMILLSGCSNEPVTYRPSGHKHNNNHNHNDNEIHIMSNGDIQEATNAKTILPSFLDQASEKVTLAYQAAVLLPEALQQIPCYCGCGESAGHRNNFDCFVAELKEDEVIWDDHGTRCGICVDIALLTTSMIKDGNTIEDIHKQIDILYGEGFGAPTS